MDNVIYPKKEYSREYQLDQILFFIRTMEGVAEAIARKEFCHRPCIAQAHDLLWQAIDNMSTSYFYMRSGTDELRSEGTE